MTIPNTCHETLGFETPASMEIFRRRLARIMAGSVGVLGGLTMFLICFADKNLAPSVLAGSWLAMGAVYALSWLLGPVSLRAADGLKSGRLRGLPEICAEKDARFLELGGILMPLAAIALLMPLTLHASLILSVEIFDHGFSGLDFGNLADTLGSWIAMSGVIVGHVHLVLIGLAVAFSMRMTRDPMGTSKHFGWWSLLVVVGASALPGALLYLIPPIITAVTGIVFIPLLFAAARRMALGERSALIASSVRYPGLRFSSNGIEEHRARGSAHRIDWARPFLIVLHRDPDTATGAKRDIHVRLFQDHGEARHSLALTLSLPSSPALDRLPPKSESLACLEGHGALELWSTILHHAEAHGLPLPLDLHPAI